jgi:hypothetical protein
MAVVKVEICPYLHRESRFQTQQHAKVLDWQRRHREIKHVLSHDKREILFHEEKYFEQFKETWHHWYKLVY